ncbi:MAG: FAD-dependent oxidoreductase [Archangium sp.]|nr:FAD-dependent oxidoreductase [Archangium sp.]
MSLERPVRVAIVGAGPAGFFTADALLRLDSPRFEVDIFERLPTPFGLVRSGVAPDHQKIKGVTRTFEKTAKHQRFRFFGNVTIGRDLSHDELAAHYDQVVYAVGSSTDRRLGIPGEELMGCHAATAFVGWYNAHPDFRDFPFDLKVERAVVVGVGNVAIDIARVLLRDRGELARTDIAGLALAALEASTIHEVVLLARRGPAQAAFTAVELEDLTHLASIGVKVDPAQLQLDAAQLEALDVNSRRNVELMRKLAANPRETARTLRLEFLASPVELLDDGNGRVCGVKVERNELLGDKARGTGQFFELSAGLVFRSIGYFGEPIAGVPFDAKAGIIPNVEGRVTRTPGGEVVPHLYAVGWIRRSPIGVIGTNKADGQAVADRLVEDVAKLPAAPPRPESEMMALLAQRRIKVTSFHEWAKLDELEVAAGREKGKVREKFDTVTAMMNELLRSTPSN